MNEKDKKGFVYILSNPSMPGLVKVGMTKKVPTERVNDSDFIATGIPTPFIVEYYVWSDDMCLAEKKAHEALHKYHHGKEFFKCDVAIAVRAIKSTGIHFLELYSNPNISTSFTDMESKGGWHRDTLKQRIAILIDECPVEVFKNPNAGLLMYKNYTLAYTSDISKHQSTDVISEVYFNKLFRRYDYILSKKEKGDEIDPLIRDAFAAEALVWLLDLNWYL